MEIWNDELNEIQQEAERDKRELELKRIVQKLRENQEKIKMEKEEDFSPTVKFLFWTFIILSFIAAIGKLCSRGADWGWETF